jgi:hypothetical protein
MDFSGKKKLLCKFSKLCYGFFPEKRNYYVNLVSFAMDFSGKKNYYLNLENC